MNEKPVQTQSCSKRIILQSWSVIPSHPNVEAREDDGDTTTNANDAVITLPARPFSHALLRDLTMELALMVIELLAARALDTTTRSAASLAAFGDAVLCLVDVISPATPDVVAIPVLRLLHTIIRKYHDHKLGLSTMYSGSRHAELGARTGVKGAGVGYIER